MKNVFFKTVDSLTQHRDSESLQRALLYALAEMLPLQDAVLYRPVGKMPVMHMEQVLKIVKSERGSSEEGAEAGYDIIDNVIEMSLASYVDKCMDQAEMVVDNSSALYRLLIPVSVDQKINMIISINGDDSIAQSNDLISGVIKIFQNFYAVVKESERDKLTSLYNRRTFDAKLNRMLCTQKNIKHQYIPKDKASNERQALEDSSAWMVIMDVDFFKKVNDKCGHVVGDEVLLQLSQKMMESFRSADYLFRFGGEEFVIILEPITYEMAELVLERFRKSIEDYEFTRVGKITVSLGFAKITENDFPATILGYADDALYYAKAHGRNRVFNYEKLVEGGELDKVDVTGSVDLF